MLNGWGKPAASGIIFCVFMLLFLVEGFLTSVFALASPGELWVFGADSMVTGDLSHQERPAVSGNIAVWTDCRSEGKDCSIFSKDLSKDDPEEELTPDLAHQNQAAIDGDLVVWRQLITPPAGGVGHQIYYKYLYRGGALPVSMNSNQQNEPAVSGGKVVWSDERNGTWESDIYMYDLSTGVEQPLCTESSRQQQPDIEGDWAIWTDNRGGVYRYGKPTMNDIYAKNVVTGEERRLTFDENTHVQTNPALGRDPVSGSYRAVWEGDGIWLYEFDSGNTTRISSTGSGPDIDDNVIIWKDPDLGEIRMYDLASGEAQTVSSGGGYAYHAAISGGRIVWGDDRNRSQGNESNRDIYQNQLTVTAQEMAERYRPELRLAPEENFEPMPVEQLLTAPGTFLRKRNDPSFVPEPNPGASGLADVAGFTDMYVDLDGDAILAGGGDPSLSIDRSYIRQRYVNPYIERRDGFPSTVYARLVKDPQGGGDTAIQYWICYAANDFSESFHEGDWELVQVDLDGSLQPFRADYSHHGGGSWRRWGSVEKSWRFPEQPVVYVAAGSHANHFYAGEFPIFLQSWDTAPGNGPTLYPGVEVLPGTEMASASPFEWLDFRGQWGEYTGAKTGFGPFAIGGLRDGPDNPSVQGYWSNPFAWPGITCDGCDDEAGQGTDLELTSHSPVEIHLYDSSGRHVGVNSAGDIESEITGAEYLDYPELDRTSIIVHGGDINDGYLMEVRGTGTGPCELVLTAPDRSQGTVETLDYQLDQVSPRTLAMMNIAAGSDYLMHVDLNGSGLEILQPPDSTEVKTVDFMPPGTVMDLRAVASTSGSVTLAFTAPGDDEGDGTARQYDLRYATATITGENWKNAVPAAGVPLPLAAGSTQVVTVSGLESGISYFFALRAEDNAALVSPTSNVVEASTLKPELNWEKERTYWDSWSDYISGQLSVDYRLGNSGPERVDEIAVANSVCSPAIVHLKSSMPMLVGSLGAGEYINLTLEYFVPDAVMNFTTTTEANCQDITGKTYRFPEPR